LLTYLFQPLSQELRADWTATLTQAFPVPDEWDSIRAKFENFSNEHFHALYLAMMGIMYMRFIEMRIIEQVLDFSKQQELRDSDIAWGWTIVSIIVLFMIVLFTYF
jgi:hypothetical protein